MVQHAQAVGSGGDGGAPGSGGGSSVPVRVCASPRSRRQVGGCWVVGKAVATSHVCRCGWGVWKETSASWCCDYSAWWWRGDVKEAAGGSGCYVEGQEVIGMSLVRVRQQKASSALRDEQATPYCQAASCASDSAGVTMSLWHPSTPGGGCSGAGCATTRA